MSINDLPLTRQKILTPPRLCPDGGTCHHSCELNRCFRVRACAPLSVYGEDWTEADMATYGQPPEHPTVEDVLVNGADS